MRFTLLLTLALHLAGCSQDEAADSEQAKADSTFLNYGEFRELEKRAKSGDVSAARRIGVYYAVYLNEPESANFWFNYAKELARPGVTINPTPK